MVEVSGFKGFADLYKILFRVTTLTERSAFIGIRSDILAYGVDVVEVACMMLPRTSCRSLDRHAFKI